MKSRLFGRWLKFNAVGAIGIVVQLAVLAVLKNRLHIHYLAATAIAVETAVLHNFVWHERWTWKNHKQPSSSAVSRLLRFHLSNGLVSLIVNLVLMRLLVGRYGMPYLAANMMSIAAGSLANFFLSEWFVFGAGTMKSHAAVGSSRKLLPVQATRRQPED